MRATWQTLIYLLLKGDLTREERHICDLAWKKYDAIKRGEERAIFSDVKKIVAKHIRTSMYTYTETMPERQLKDDQLLSIF